jgi:hypothetical protein
MPGGRGLARLWHGAGTRQRAAALWLTQRVPPPVACAPACLRAGGNVTYRLSQSSKLTNWTCATPSNCRAVVSVVVRARGSRAVFALACVAAVSALLHALS